jgi:hypothetical protein
MAHYAKIENDVVKQVIVADEDFIRNLDGEWIQTSYNTRAGVHPENRPLRKNFAGIGYNYDRQRDAFIAPKPFKSWVLVEQTCLWNSPVPYPNDGKDYYWNELTLSWIINQE